MAGAGEAVGGIMTGLANMANSIVQPISAKRQQKRNQKYAKDNARLEADLQLQNNLRTMEQQQAYNVKNYEQQRDDNYAREDYLLANQKKLEVQALRDAGLNPALAGISVGGFQPGASVGGASIDAPAGGASGVGVNAPSYGSPFTGVNIGDAVANSLKTAEELKILKAEARKRKEEADALEMENQGTREENDYSQYSLLNKLMMREDGTFYTTDENGDHDFDVSSRPIPKTKAGIFALQTFNKMLADSAHYLSSQNRDFLDSMVSGLQIQDEKVLESLKNMPNELIRELRSKNSLHELEAELKASEKYFWKKVDKLDNDVIKFLASAFLTFRK